MVDMPTYGEPPPTPPTSGARPPTGRTALLLIIFVVLAVLLVGVVNKHSPGTSATATSRVHSETKSTASTTTTTTVPPGTVGVLVANGSSGMDTNDAASSYTSQLQTSGWKMLPATNATATVATSAVYYAVGFQPSATAIATSLHIPATSVHPLTSSVPVSPVTGADVVVVIGNDLASSTSST